MTPVITAAICIQHNTVRNNKTLTGIFASKFYPINNILFLTGHDTRISMYGFK